MNSNTAVVVVAGGAATIEYIPDNMNVLIVDMDSPQVYTYNGSSCTIESTNEDGTVNVVIVDGTENGKRILRNIPAGDLEWLSDLEDYDENLGDWVDSLSYESDE